MDAIVGNSKFTATYDTFDEWRKSFKSHLNVAIDETSAQDYVASRFSAAGSTNYIACLQPSPLKLIPTAISADAVSLRLRFANAAGQSQIYVDSIDSTGPDKTKVVNESITLDGEYTVFLARKADADLLAKAVAYNAPPDEKGRQVLYSADVKIPADFKEAPKLPVFIMISKANVTVPSMTLACPAEATATLQQLCNGTTKCEFTSDVNYLCGNQLAEHEDRYFSASVLCGQTSSSIEGWRHFSITCTADGLKVK